MASYGLLVRQRKRRKAVTTDSNHPFRRYPNLVRDLQTICPNHLWVSDITYISMQDRFCYLSLVTDAYSRKIVGYCLYPNLKKEGSLQALDMALNTLKGKHVSLIHHSDRGLQYCCTDYTERLERNKIRISMTEKGDPYENAIAERVNGILKCEFALDRDFESIEAAGKAVDQAIEAYNHLRPHASCNYMTPAQAHLGYGVLPMKWKKKYKERLKPTNFTSVNKIRDYEMTVNKIRD